jgi:hypothetical protein
MPWRVRAALTPCLAALLCAAILTAATVWAAKPVYGPLHAEFTWPPLAIVTALLLSLGVSVAALRPLDGWSRVRTARGWATGGLLGGAAAILLLLPNLTHLWQFGAALALIGLARSAVLVGLWRTLRVWLRPAVATAALTIAGLAGIWPAAVIIGDTVYRNSWREGVAACGGLLLLAAPLAYILLPGREATALGRLASGALADERTGGDLAQEFDRGKVRGERDRVDVRVDNAGGRVDQTEVDTPPQQ